MAGAGLLATGCVYRERTVYRPAPGAPVVATSEVEVVGPPPVEIVETRTIQPGPEFVWVGGYYGWAGGGWRWTPGYWGRPPRPGAIWVGPRYAYRGGRHVWVRGYWR